MRFAAIALLCLSSFVATAKEPIDACSLLLDSEVRTSVDHDSQAGERDDQGEIEPGTYSSTCLWRLRAGGGFVILNAMRFPAGGEGAQHYLQSFRDAARDGTIDGDPEPIDIGDEALWWGDGVALRKGGTSVGISVHLPGERQKERPLEEYLAQTIATRL